MDKGYVDTVRLLLDAAPEVFRSGLFAMKGGTAINLFVQDVIGGVKCSQSGRG